MKIARRRLVGAGAAAALVAAMVAGWNTLPGAGLRWALVDGLRRLGMAEVTLSDADVSLFGGQVVVRQVVAKAPSGQPLALRDLNLGFHWRPLLNKRIVVDSVALEGLDIEVRRTAKGIEINGLPLAVSGGGGDSWAYDLGSLRLSNSRLAVSDGAAKVVVELDRLDLDGLSSGSPEAPVHFTLAGRANGAPLTLAGSATPFAADPGFTLRLDVDRFDLAQLAPALAPLRLLGRLDAHLAINGRVAEWEGAGTLKLDAPVVAAPGLDGSARSATVDLAGLHRKGDHLTAKGSAELAGLEGKAEPLAGGAALLHLDAAELAWDRRAGRLAWTGAVRAQQPKVTGADFDASPERVAWSGQVEVEPASGRGHAEGHLDADKVQAGSGGLVATQRRLAVDGRAEFAAEGATATLGLAIDGLLLRDPKRQQDWVAAERLEAGDLQLSTTGGVAIARLAAKGAAVLRRDRGAPGKGFPWRAEARELAAERLRLEVGGAAGAASVSLNGLTLRLTRTAAGFIGLADLPTAQPAPAAPSSPPQPTPPLALGRLSVSGGSTVIFEDRTTPERVHLDLRSVELALSDLDSGKPDRDSPFSLNAEVGEATIAAHGAVRPFAADLSGSVIGEIRGLELPPLSPYAADALGVTLHTGHFDGKLQVQARRRALEGQMDLVLSDLFLDEPAPNAPLRRKVDLPIETVLDLLRDGEDRIRLAIPIGGDLANPDFDVSDAVSQAVAGALRSTAVTTLKVMFPVAAIIGMVIDANEQHLSLQPLAFAAGAEELPADAGTRLDGVAELLRARPNLKLKLCGKAGPGDWPGLYERRRQERQPLLFKLSRMVGLETEVPQPNHDLLLQLAERRAAVTKEYLADRAGIDAARLFECRPQVEAEGKAPRVELLL
jgi:hypothetical protein